MDVAPAPPASSGGDHSTQQAPISPNQNANQAPVALAKATTIENGVQTGGAKKPESCGESPRLANLLEASLVSWLTFTF